jgi:hypothetical protein
MIYIIYTLPHRSKENYNFSNEGPFVDYDCCMSGAKG